MPRPGKIHVIQNQQTHKMIFDDNSGHYLDLQSL